MGMVQVGEDAGFNEKRFHILGVGDSFRVRHLDGYGSVEVIVMSKIDPSEPTLTQASEDRVTPNFGGIAARGATRTRKGRLRAFGFGEVFVSSEEPPEPSAAAWEPSVSERFFVSSIARSLTMTDHFHDCIAESLSHPEPGQRSGARALSN